MELNGTIEEKTDAAASHQAPGPEPRRPSVELRGVEQPQEGRGETRSLWNLTEPRREWTEAARNRLRRQGCLWRSAPEEPARDG